MRRTARHLVVSPDVLHRLGLDPDEIADRLSADYLVAVNARSVREVGAIVGASSEDQRVPTLTLDAVVGFRSPDDRSAFAAELQASVAALVARYHHDDGRPHRLMVTSYPRPSKETS